jgi:hypothetical protein
MYDVFLSEAERLIEKRKYRDALAVLKSIWKNNKTELVATKILYCLRQLRFWREVDSWLITFEQRFPKSEMIKEQASELNYDRTVGETINSDNFTEINKKVDELSESITDNNRLNLLYMQLIKKAKEKKAWDEVQNFIEKIDPSLLDRSRGGKRISDLEKFYLNKIDLFEAINDSIKLEQTCLEAINAFPEHFTFVKRLLILYRATSNLESLSAYLDKHLNFEEPNWFLIEQYAYIQLIEANYEDAWHWVCRAFNTKGDQIHKVDLHLLISDIAEKLEKLDLAKDFKTLSVLVRAENKLAIPADLLKHIKTLTDQSITKEFIVNKYQSEIVDGIYRNEERFDGKIVFYPLDKNFVRIKYQDTKSILAFKQDIDDDCQYESANITFIIRETFDKKNGKKSKLAKLVRRQVKLA